MASKAISIMTATGFNVSLPRAELHLPIYEFLLEKASGPDEP